MSTEMLPLKKIYIIFILLNFHTYFFHALSSVGAALVAENNHAPTVFAGIVYNPLCFLLYEDLRAPPNEWKNVSACTFSP